MSEEELGPKMVEEIPEEGPYFWSRINAGLKQIEILEDFSETDIAEHVEQDHELAVEDVPQVATAIQTEAPALTVISADESLVASVDSVKEPKVADKEAPVVSVDAARSSNRSRYLLATAAAVVVLAGGVLVLQYDNLFGSSKSENLTATKSVETSSVLDASNYDNEIARPAAADEMATSAFEAAPSVEEGEKADFTAAEEDMDDSKDRSSVAATSVVTTTTTAQDVPDPESVSDIEAKIIDFPWLGDFIETFEPVEIKEIKFIQGSSFGIETGSLENEQTSLYYLDASEGQQLSAEIIGGLDFSIEIYDAEGSSVANGMSFVDFDLSSTGTYYIAVTNNEGIEGDYDLGIEIL